jgi:hypothetical protein
MGIPFDLWTFDATPCRYTCTRYQLEDEPLCVAIIKGGTKVVCGTQEGSLGIYAWGAWDDVQDRMLGHPTSVDTIVKLSEDTVCCGVLCAVRCLSVGAYYVGVGKWVSVCVGGWVCGGWVCGGGGGGVGLFSPVSIRMPTLMTA